MTTPLEIRIRAMIEKDGPMPVNMFMALCLTDPEDGYYRSIDPLGAAGDFTTAPEISQMFGELVGLWLYDEAIKQGVAGDAALVELGPGRGTLMKDALRCYAGIAPEYCWDLHLVEVNPALIAAQRERLSDCSNARPHWHEQISDLPEKPLLIIANEFFDALPVRQFKSNSGKWYECMLDLADDALTPVTMSAPAETDLPPPSADGQIAEFCPQLEAIITSLAGHINRHGGAMLIIDYGKNNALGDSLQAVQAHRPVEIMHEPGKADLSAWVDFGAIARHAAQAGLAAFGPEEQGSFLKAIGLYHRAEQLATGATAETRREIAAAVDRLSSPAQMGTAFKVMALRPQDAPLPVAGM